MLNSPTPSTPLTPSTPPSTLLGPQSLPSIQDDLVSSPNESNTHVATETVETETGRSCARASSIGILE